MLQFCTLLIFCKVTPTATTADCVMLSTFLCEGGAHDAMVIIVRNGHGGPSLNLAKSMTILCPSNYG